MKKIILAPNSFKGSMTASRVGEAMARGARAALKSVHLEIIPLADGGDGFLEALLYQGGVSLQELIVKDPLGRSIKSAFGLLADGRTAVIEMARASGLALLSEGEANPMLTSSYGTGELIKGALEQGCRKIILGLGGSASNDGGLGLAQALGAKFYDKEGQLLGFGGQNLVKLATMDLSGLPQALESLELIIASDVENPMLGPQGATRVYGPQKGARPEMIELLEEGLENLAQIIKREKGKEVAMIAGSGAAGGIGGGLLGFLGGEIVSGIELVLEMVNFYQRIEGAHLIITGEGAIDSQTAYGKVPFGVGKIAQKKRVPVVALAGSVSGKLDLLRENGITAFFPIIDGPMSLDQAMEKGESLVEKISQEVVRLFFAACKELIG